MTKILVVDDDENHCRQLALALTDHGFRVETANSGREAIDLGAWSRPDIMIADWILDEITGLKVAETLRLVKPDLSFILMTGFSSTRLEREAWELEAFALLEKPLELEEMLRTATDAAAMPAVDRPSPVAVLGTLPDGEIAFANPKARKLLASTRAGSQATRIQELLGQDARRKLRLATREWQEVEALADEPIAWQVRARSAPTTQGSLMVLLEGEQFLAQPDPEQRYYETEVLAQLLLDTPAAAQPRWPFAIESRALVVDASDLFCHLAVTEFERAGAICHSASDAGSALQILQRDPGINVILLDEQVLTETPELIDELRDLRPEAVIAGQSLDRYQYAFAARGVDRFLRKPWELEDLLLLLQPQENPLPSESAT